jgi:Enoyl-(Acyl carrier protein) reductase
MVSTVNGGVIGLMNTLLVALAPVRVNVIHPGIVGESPHWRERDLSRVVARTPCGRLVQMDDVVDAVAFLLRNWAVNGVSLNIDGGTLLGYARPETFPGRLGVIRRGPDEPGRRRDPPRHRNNPACSACPSGTGHRRLLLDRGD